MRDGPPPEEQSLNLTLLSISGNSAKLDLWVRATKTWLHYTFWLLIDQSIEILDHQQEDWASSDGISSEFIPLMQWDTKAVVEEVRRYMEGLDDG